MIAHLIAGAIPVRIGGESQNDRPSRPVPSRPISRVKHAYNLTLGRPLEAQCMAADAAEIGGWSCQ